MESCDPQESSGRKIPKNEGTLEHSGQLKMGMRVEIRDNRIDDPFRRSHFRQEIDVGALGPGPPQPEQCAGERDNDEAKRQAAEFDASQTGLREGASWHVFITTND